MREALSEPTFHAARTVHSQPEATGSSRGAGSATKEVTAAGRDRTHPAAREQVLHLQRTYGNQVVLRLMRMNAEHASVSRTPGTTPADELAERDANGVMPGAAAAVGRAQVQGGHPLPNDIKTSFGASLGTDLSGVRVHTDSHSAEAATALGAHAYALGQDIHFGANKYAPQDPAGLHLLAHEVVHTAQQSTSPTAPQAQLAVSTPQDPAELEAESLAQGMTSGALQASRTHQDAPLNPIGLREAESSVAVHRDPDPAKASKSPPANADAGPQGTQNFPVADRADYYVVFQLALQGTSGKAHADAKQKASLAAQVTDAAMAALDSHGKKVVRVKAAAKDDATRKSLDAALAGLNSPWGDFFKSAFQTTAGGDYKTPDIPSKEAVDIANQAVFRAGMLDKDAWDLFMKQ